MNSKLMMVLIGILIVIIIRLIGGSYFVYTKLNQSPNSPNNDKVEKIEDNSKRFFKTNINDLVLNVTNAKGRSKLMKLSLTIKSNQETIEIIVEDTKRELVDSIIQLISSRPSEELLTLGGKNLLKEEIIETFNEIINQNYDFDDSVKKDNIKKILS